MPRPIYTELSIAMESNLGKQKETCIFQIKPGILSVLVYGYRDRGTWEQVKKRSRAPCCNVVCM